MRVQVADGRAQKREEHSTTGTGAVEEKQLVFGDLFLIYMDDVTEACVPESEEYREARLIELVRNQQQTAAEILRNTGLARAKSP